MTVIDDLSKPFHPDEYYYNGGNLYVPVESVIRRLNDVLGIGWDWNVDGCSFIVSPDKAGKEKDKTQYTAVVHGTLSVWDPLWDSNQNATGRSFRSATGGCTNFDIDTAVKGAGSEALKKAASAFGVNLDIMGKSGAPTRELVDALKAFVDDQSGANAKRVLITKARNDGVDPITPATVAAHFGMGLNDDGRMPDDESILAAKEMIG